MVVVVVEADGWGGIDRTLSQNRALEKARTYKKTGLQTGVSTPVTNLQAMANIAHK